MITYAWLLSGHLRVLIFSEKPPIPSTRLVHRQREPQAAFKFEEEFKKFRKVVAEEGLEPPTRGL